MRTMFEDHTVIDAIMRPPQEWHHASIKMPSSSARNETPWSRPSTDASASAVLRHCTAHIQSSAALAICVKQNARQQCAKRDSLKQAVPHIANLRSKILIFVIILITTIDSFNYLTNFRILHKTCLKTKMIYHTMYQSTPRYAIIDDDMQRTLSGLYVKRSIRRLSSCSTYSAGERGKCMQ